MLRQGIQGISELITEPGLINLDFADVKTVMSNAGSALMAIGQGKGDNRAADAAKAAIANPLLDVSMSGAKGVLFNVTGGDDLTLNEINQAAEIVSAAADPEANIIFGAVVDSTIDDEIRITVIATGFDGYLTAKTAAAFDPLDILRQQQAQLTPHPAPRAEAPAATHLRQA